MRLSPLGTSATIWPIVTAPDDDESAADSGMMAVEPSALCARQIPHDLFWFRARVAAMRSWNLTA
jgi:hypothetical protein